MKFFLLVLLSGMTVAMSKDTGNSFRKMKHPGTAVDMGRKRAVQIQGSSQITGDFKRKELMVEKRGELLMLVITLMMVSMCSNEEDL